MKTKDYVLLVIVFLIPFARGIYFMHSIFILGVFGLLILISYAKENQKIVIPYDISSILLYIIILMYGISILYSIDKGMAFLGFSKFIVIIIYYFIFAQLKQEQKTSLITVITWSGIVMACISLISIFITSLMAFTFQNNRLGGFFQYANSFGLYMLIISILITEQKDKIMYFLPLIISCIYLTYSRSLYLFSATVLFIMILLNKKRVKFILLIFCGVFLGYLCSSLGHVTESIERIKHMSLQVSEWQTRLLYYFDGLNIIRDNSFGVGYLGFYYIQRMYQSGVYYVKFVHNSFIQIGIDIGVVGILCLIGFICTSIYNNNLNKKYKGILLLIFAHSMIDFDLQFTFFWILIVLILSMSNNKNKVYCYRFGHSLLAIVLISLNFYLFIVTGTYYIGKYDITYRLYPYHTEAGVKLVRMYKQEKEEKAVMIAKRVLQLNKNVYYLNSFLRDYYIDNNDYYTAYYYGKNARELYPLSLNDLEKYTEILLILVKSDIIDNELKQDMLLEVLSIEDYIKEVVDRLDKKAFQIKHKPNIELSEQLIKLRAEASRIYWDMYRKGDEIE